MTNDASWRIQVSYKTQSGTLINCRAESAPELLAQIQWVQENAGEIHAGEQSLSATGTVAAAMPLATPQQPPAPQGFGSAAPLPAQSQPVAPPAAPSFGASGAAPQQWQQPQQQPLQAVGQQPGPVCNHGIAAKYVAGGISKTGRAYKPFFACSMPREQDCRFRQDAA